MSKMPRTRIFLSLFVIFIAIIPASLTAEDIDEAIKLFNAGEFGQARQIFEQIIKEGTNPRIAEAFFHIGRLSVNYPDSQLYYYRLVIKNYPQSRYADIAYLEMAKNYICRDNYASALTLLLDLKNNYPETKIKDELLLWLGITYIAIDQKEDGFKTLKELISTYPKSVWSERAREVMANQQPQPPKEYFAVQVGSYRNMDNARKYGDTLKAKGYDVNIVEALISGTTYYRVWLGSFPTKEEAREFAKKLESQGIKGNVVKGY